MKTTEEILAEINRLLAYYGEHYQKIMFKEDTRYEVGTISILSQLKKFILSEPEPEKKECEHESNGDVLTSNPVQYKCKKCGEFYR